MAGVYSCHVHGRLSGGSVCLDCCGLSGYAFRWNLFYAAPLGLGVINLVLVIGAFHDSLRLTQQFGQSPPESRQKGLQEMKQTLCTPSVWLLSLYFFFFLGAAITAGGM